MKHTCPVCAWPHLHEPPRTKSGGASYEICPSCGFQFGVSDDDQGHSIATWRATWIARGHPWSSPSQPAPADWNPPAQLTKHPQS